MVSGSDKSPVVCGIHALQTCACLLLNDVCLVSGKSQVVCGIHADPCMSSVE